MAREPWWRNREDTEQAWGFHSESFAGTHVREVLLVKGLPPAMSVWSQTALVVRIYETGNITLREGEWRP